MQRELLELKSSVVVANVCPDLAFRDVEALAVPFQSLELLTKIAEGGYAELHKVWNRHERHSLFFVFGRSQFFLFQW